MKQELQMICDCCNVVFVVHSDADEKRIVKHCPYCGSQEVETHD